MNQPNEGMRERFEKEFNIPASIQFLEKFRGSTATDYVFQSHELQREYRHFSFIEQEIDLALAKQRSQIVEIIKSFEIIPNNIEDTEIANALNRITYPMIKQKLISTITKDTKE